MVRWAAAWFITEVKCSKYYCIIMIKLSEWANIYNVLYIFVIDWTVFNYSFYEMANKFL